MQKRASGCSGSVSAISTIAAVSSRSTSRMAAVSRSRCEAVSGSSSEAASASLRRSSSPQLLPARGRGARHADALVAARRRHGDQPGGLERAQQPAEVARVEPEPRPQRAHLRAVRTDLPQHPRLAERAVARQEVIVERADALRHGAVEAADLLDLLRGHYLTLVR